MPVVIGQRVPVVKVDIIFGIVVDELAQDNADLPLNVRRTGIEDAGILPRIDDLHGIHSPLAAWNDPVHVSVLTASISKRGSGGGSSHSSNRTARVCESNDDLMRSRKYGSYFTQSL